MSVLDNFFDLLKIWREWEDGGWVGSVDLMSLESHHLPHLGQCRVFGVGNCAGSKVEIQSMVLIERLHGINKGKAQEWPGGSTEYCAVQP